MSEKARIYATAAHAACGQKRKFSGLPYIIHPEAVVKLLKTRPHTEAMVEAAWLHDVVEDTQVSIFEIQEEFGLEVAQLVSHLTDPVVEGNRAYRKRCALESLAKASPEAQTIKVCDLIHNTADILQQDPGFAKVYITEKDALLEVLVHADPLLRTLAKENITHAIQEDDSMVGEPTKD